MINSVRNTILAILNKNNYGYISPADFNLFAKQAQLDIFDDYFYQYNQLINKENARLSGTGYADIRKGYEEVIDLSYFQDEDKALEGKGVTLFDFQGRCLYVGETKRAHRDVIAKVAEIMTFERENVRES